MSGQQARQVKEAEQRGISFSDFVEESKKPRFASTKKADKNKSPHVSTDDAGNTGVEKDKRDVVLSPAFLSKIEDAAQELPEACRRRAVERMRQAAIETCVEYAAKAAPRLQWPKDALPEEQDNPAAFAWRAYEPEAKAGMLHMGIIRKDDKRNGTDLAVKLVSWLRSPANREKLPEGFDIPTLPEWNTRQLSKIASDPAAQEAIRLVGVERQRQVRANKFAA